MMRNRKMTKLLPISGKVALKRMEAAGMDTAALQSEVLKESTEEVDLKDIRSVMYLAELEGVERAMEHLDKAERCSLNDYGKCYKELKRLGANDASLLQFVETAKSFYRGFEEYIECMGF